MTDKLSVFVVGIVIAVAGAVFVLLSPHIARVYNGLYSRLPGRMQFADWWPRVFGAALLTFGLLFVVLAVAVVH